MCLTSDSIFAIANSGTNPDVSNANIRVSIYFGCRNVNTISGDEVIAIKHIIYSREAKLRAQLFSVSNRVDNIVWPAKHFVSADDITLFDFLFYSSRTYGLPFYHNRLYHHKIIKS